MKTLFSIVLALCTLAGFAQPQQNKIHGTWHSKSLGDQVTLILHADGSGEFDGEAITYTAKDSKFTMTIVAESETIKYNYLLNGNSLTISGGDLETPVTFARSGSSTEQSGEKNN